MSSSKPLFISEAEVLDLLNWDSVVEATEQAIIAVSENLESGGSSAMQPARSITLIPDVNGKLYTMPAYVKDINLNGKTVSALGCKLARSFTGNAKQNPPLININATILLFDDKTGQLKCVMGGTEITGWRTAAASVVATKHLRKKNAKNKILAIYGSGVQGKSHARALQHCIGFDEIRIWNYNHENAVKLVNELREELGTKITACESGEECAKDADVIVTATFASEPILKLDWVKPEAHINAMGTSTNHYSELDIPLYRASNIFVDNWAGANEELSGLKDFGATIIAEVGQVIKQEVQVPDGITVFHGMGMAVEDAATAKLIYDLYCNKNNITE